MEFRKKMQQRRTIALSYMALGLVLVILVGAYRVNAGLCGPGAITAFLTYFTIILNAMMSITRVLTMWSKALASADRIEEVLATGDELTVQWEMSAEGVLQVDIQKHPEDKNIRIFTAEIRY
jgi:ABC-type multidrug transport system fused ATPase/permease subunit